MNELWSIENEIYDAGYHVICGVDEAGRGPLAGPVCAAACILPREIEIPGLNDSKKLTEKKRCEIFEIVKDRALTFAVAFATVEEIEQLNILGATMLAMNRAIGELETVPELCLIDGNRTKGIDYPARAIVKGDAQCADIAAASILAKVTRDAYMYDMDEKYPQYGFAAHKGYGTAAHYAALKEFGPSPIHRPSFLKKIH